MAQQKPTLPKGTRDFGPKEMVRRNFILDTIKSVYKSYGFMPLETPAMENLSVLLGKYGDEGDTLLFKILNSGDFLKKATPEDIDGGYQKLMPKVAEKGLRYDLTVPFARYVVMNQHALAFPFKRYQIQPVWRADRPQKGRYREFYQCDADMVGTDSLLCEAEIMAMIHKVYEELGIKDIALKINNRKILTGITEIIGAEGKEEAFCVAIDKLDKIGKEKVKEELADRGFSSESIEKVEPIFGQSAQPQEALQFLEGFLQGSPIGMQGVEELKTVFAYYKGMNLPDDQIELDITLARGLSYYTGAIFEVKALGVSIGSITGGGRYDSLTDTFGLAGVSGVGISFGIDRIYDVMEELELFPTTQQETTQLLIIPFDEAAFQHALPILQQFRTQGIATELYPDLVKLKKSMKYANDKDIPYVMLLGSEEMQSQRYTLKHMESGEQEALPINEIFTKF